MPADSNLTSSGNTSLRQTPNPGWKFLGLSGLLVVLGFVFGFYLVSLSPGIAVDNQAFYASAEFEIWRALVAASFGIWVCSIP